MLKVNANLSFIIQITQTNEASSRKVKCINYRIICKGTNFLIKQRVRLQSSKFAAHDDSLKVFLSKFPFSCSRFKWKRRQMNEIDGKTVGEERKRSR
jgi:hypothetical protein